jgi:hypothetical protein
MKIIFAFMLTFLLGCAYEEPAQTIYTQRITEAQFERNAQILNQMEQADALKELAQPPFWAPWGCVPYQTVQFSP